MKTKEQVIRYISLRHYSNDDWELLAQYVKSHYDVARVKKARRAKLDSTYQEFLDWEDKGLGECDMIATPDGLLGICHDTGSGYILMATYYNQVLNVRDTDFPVTWCRASEEQEAELRLKLRDELYACSQSLGVVYSIPEPPKGVVIKLSGEKKRYGIIKSVKDKVVRFWALLEDDELILNAKMHQGDIIIDPLNATEREKFFVALESRAMYWDAEKSKLKSHIIRSGSGERYWYINEKFDIIESKDYRRRVDDIRYKSRNYFTEYTKVARLRKVMHDLLKELD